MSIAVQTNVFLRNYPDYTDQILGPVREFRLKRVKGNLFSLFPKVRDVHLKASELAIIEVGTGWGQFNAIKALCERFHSNDCIICSYAYITHVSQHDIYQSFGRLSYLTIVLTC